jgi:hypothetical protein
MESQSTQRERAHPLCPLRHIHLEDLELTMCDALADEERRQQARADQQSFQLHLQFVRAHGLPKGEVTLFSSGGGVWSPGVDRLL